MIEEIESINFEHELWTADDAAAYMRVKKRRFLAHIAPKPGFPAPVTPAGIRPRWYAHEVKQYVEDSRREKAIA